MLKNVLKKLLLAIIVIGGYSINAYAQNAICLTDPQGEKLFFLLNEKPTISLGDNVLRITTVNESLGLEFNGTYVCEFCDYTSGINEVESFITFKINDDALEGLNLKANSPVIISDLSGKVIKSQSSDGAGNVVISLSDIPSGIYIVNSPDKNFKFYKK